MWITDGLTSLLGMGCVGVAAETVSLSDGKQSSSPDVLTAIAAMLTEESVYCEECGSCGEEGCCGRSRCKYPQDRPETLDKIESLEREVEALRRDALRYRWMRSYGLAYVRWEGLTPDTCDIGLDYAIDCRIQGGETPD